MWHVYCNDCMKQLATFRHEGREFDHVIVDPPYGITNCSWDTPLDLDRMWELLRAVTRPTSNIIVFSRQPFTSVLNASNLKEFRYEVIWMKTQATAPMLSKVRILPIHENISIFYRKKGTYNPQMRMGFKNYGGTKSEGTVTNRLYGNVYSMHRDCKDGSRYPVSVLVYKNVRYGVHPTQKPVELLEYLVATYSDPGDTILDFTMGSGSTGVACKNIGRNFVGIEKDVETYRLAIKRLKGEL